LVSERGETNCLSQAIGLVDNSFSSEETVQRQQTVRSVVEGRLKDDPLTVRRTFGLATVDNVIANESIDDLKLNTALKKVGVVVSVHALIFSAVTLYEFDVCHSCRF
jgi:hypothetical protein